METHPPAKKGSSSLHHPSPLAGRDAQEQCTPAQMPSSLLMQQSCPATQGGRTGSGWSSQFQCSSTSHLKETLGVSANKNGIQIWKPDLYLIHFEFTAM